MGLTSTTSSIYPNLSAKRHLNAKCRLFFELEMNRNAHVFKIAVHLKERNIFLISFRFITFKFNQRKHFCFLKPDFSYHRLPPVMVISKPPGARWQVLLLWKKGLRKYLAVWSQEEPHANSFHF